MIWVAVLVCLLGMFIGLRYRAPALVPSSIAIFVLALVFNDEKAGSILPTIVFAFLLVAALHAGYLGGLVLREVFGR